MQQPSFKLIFNFNEFILPSPFKYLIEFPQDIQNSLIFNPEHEYRVTSKVSEKVFETFFKYLTNDEQPAIDMHNIHEFIELSHEFLVMSDIVSEKKRELGEYFINLNGLRPELQEESENAKDVSYYEGEIAKKLDDYVSDRSYGCELMKSPIQSLFNIFNHSERRLTRQDDAYELIKDHFGRTGDSRIFILLDSLDGSELSRSNAEDSLSKEAERMHHKPKFDFSYISESFERSRHLEERVQYLEHKLEEIMIKLDEQHEHILEVEKKGEEDKRNIETSQEQVKDSLTQRINSQNQDISTITNKISHFFSTNLDIESPGILSELHDRSKTRFDRLFISSQSSNDIYNLFDPRTNDKFCTTDDGDFFIEIELQEAVNINGVKIFSSTQSFPKSFDIEIDGNKKKSITSASELNGANKEMKIDIDPTLCHKFKFIQTGPNWDKGSNFLWIKRIELLSSESKYSGGVFSTLVSSNSNKDPHRCPVIMSSTCFDHNTFHSLDSPTNTWTFNYKNSWFQIELTRGFAILNGFRLKRHNNGKLKSYKIICTDDSKKSTDEWTTLIEINETNENEHEILDIYEFSQPSPPVRFIRLIQTGPSWKNDLSLKFHHFDLFGFYI